MPLHSSAVKTINKPQPNCMCMWVQQIRVTTRIHGFRSNHAKIWPALPRDWNIQMFTKYQYAYGSKPDGLLSTPFSHISYFILQHPFNIHLIVTTVDLHSPHSALQPSPSVISQHWHTSSQSHTTLQFNFINPRFNQPLMIVPLLSTLVGSSSCPVRNLESPRTSHSPVR